MAEDTWLVNALNDNTLSSSTAGLMKERALLPLHWLFNASIIIAVIINR